MRSPLTLVFAFCFVVQPSASSAKACAPSKEQLEALRSRAPDRSKQTVAKPLPEEAKLPQSEIDKMVDRGLAGSGSIPPIRMQPCANEDLRVSSGNAP